MTTNPFSLYSSLGEGNPIVAGELDKATAKGQELIRSFLVSMKQWQERHTALGAKDTASRDAFAYAAARALGFRFE